MLSGVAVRLANTVSVRFNGVDADVRFAGLSGAGLNQVNVVVPEGLPSGDVEVVAEILDLVTPSGAFVTVESPGAPLPPAPRPSVTLTAEPNFIVRGKSATLRWTSQNATSTVLSPGIGPVATNGSLVVSPSSTTTYTITVMGEGGEASASVRVTVREPTPPPSVTLTAEPESIVRGESVTLRWLSQNATSAELNPAFGSVATSGSLRITPSRTTTYTITVKGDGGEASATVTVTVREPTPPPSAPTNLKATAVSQVRINLSWTNTATNARSVRVELRVGSSGAFREFPSSFNPRTNALGVIQLSALTTYTFRVRAEGEGGFSPYSNLASATTQAKLTVFLVHPNPANMRDLDAGLRDPVFGIDQQRFDVDWEFNYFDCRPSKFLCRSTCSISEGARILANHINEKKPQGEIVIVGYSMGGLVARDMLLKYSLGRRVAALITIATPNGGYPYIFPDSLVGCGPVQREMDGNWRSRQSENIVVLSKFLFDLNDSWGNSSFTGNPQRWLVMSGTSCDNPRRELNPTTGCPDRNVFSDGVVCDVSARLDLPMNRPTHSWSRSNYTHARDGLLANIGQALILCGPERQFLPFNLNYAQIRRSHRRWSCGGRGSRVDAVI